MTRVLVVDDHVEAAEGLAELIRLWGHQAMVAHDGRGALAMAREAPPDVVLLDLGLPGESGVDVGRRLRDVVGTGAMRLMALTGRCGPAERADTAAAGFERHLTKPVDLDELALILSGQLGS